MMKRKFIFLLAVVFTFGLVTCDDKEEGNDLTFVFKLNYGLDPLVLFKEYKLPGAQTIFFSRFSMFVSDIKLIKGNEVKTLNQVDYLDLTQSHATIEDAKKGFELKFSKVPSMVYDSLVMTIGVVPQNNNKIPSDFNQKPLSDQAEYWGDWKSYIFSRTEGKVDLNSDGVPETGFALHTGGNDGLRTIRLKYPISVDFDNLSKYIVEIDLRKQFSGNQSLYDIAKNPQIHSRSQAAQVKELADNLSKAFNIK
jgi:hypothetical protein